MHPTTLAIVGAGPRGLTVLERVLEHADRLPPEARLRIELYDRGACGQGVHRAEQPDHLLINTLASQITMFAPRSVAGDGPSLVEWAAGAGYRRVGDRFLRAGTAGRPIGADDHLPRSLLGAYLSFVYQRVVERLPAHIEVVHRRERVVDLIERDGGFERGFTVVAEEGAARPADFVVLATGHGRRKPTAEDRDHAAFAARGVARNRNLAYHSSPYPIERLDAVSASATVAIQGFGLTAHDAVSALTLGRGGRYEEAGGGLSYRPSGREPRIVLFSRSCLPFAARGINQKGLTGRHCARFFTPEAVAAIRQEALTATGDGRIDFEGAVLPLVVKEMAYAYREAASGAAPDPSGFMPTQDEMRAIAAILHPLDGRTFASSAAFNAFFDRLLAEDLSEAQKGNRASPVKAATDVLRDTREAIRAAVEYGGLTPQSHHVFVEEFNGTINRVAFGPPKRRNLEYLALREAGLIRVGGGPGARVRPDEDEARFRIETPYADGIEAVQADVLVVARLDTYSPLTDDSPLTANLLARGLIRPYRNGAYHPGGIDIDAGLHAVGAAGQAHPRLWALGYPVEGPHYYTHALPRPGIASRQTRDAEICVLAMLDTLTGIRSAVPIPAPRPTALGAVQARLGAP